MDGNCHTAWPASLSCVTPFGSATWLKQHRLRPPFLSLAAWQAYGSCVPSKPTRHRPKHCRAPLELSVAWPATDAVYCRNTVSLQEERLAVSCMMDMIDRLTTVLPKAMWILFLSLTQLRRRSFSTSGGRSKRITCTGGPAVLPDVSAALDPEGPTRVRPLSGMVSMPISTDFDMDRTVAIRIDGDQQYVGSEIL